MYNNGDYYHIYNRGVEKRRIFMCGKDYERFLLSMKEFNTIEAGNCIKDIIKSYSQVSDTRINPGVGHLVEVISYCLINNHYHLILKQNNNGGISEFMKRLNGGYTNY